ncbi:MAG: hypothetical protein U0892_09670 [Pirellulales bacterium]
MWTCEKCGSNLLANTESCPICTSPGKSADLYVEPTRKTESRRSKSLYVIMFFSACAPIVGWMLEPVQPGIARRLGFSIAIIGLIILTVWFVNTLAPKDPRYTGPVEP